MSKDPQDNVPENWGWDWTSETMDEHSAAHAPADRANNEARRPAGAYARAELGQIQASAQDKAGIGDLFRRRNAALESKGLAPETSPVYWAKHSAKDERGQALASKGPTENAWNAPVRERGRHKKGVTYR